MTRLEKYLVATATEIIEAETTVSRYFVIGNVKVRVSDHLSKMSDADELLDSLDNKFVRLRMVDPAAAKITLSKIEEDECGATYLCKSKNYNDRVWICAVTLSVFGEYPQNIYLKDM